MSRRKPRTIGFWSGRLPHWEVEGGRYFVTIHLANSIPEEGQRRIRALSKLLQRESIDYASIQRKIFIEMETWLDRCETRPLLTGQVARAVVEAIEKRQQDRVWDVFEYVVMPNHLRLFFEVCRGSLKTVLEDLKKWTGRRAGRWLDLRRERFWQREWFDRWSRSTDEDERITS